MAQNPATFPDAQPDDPRAARDLLTVLIGQNRFKDAMALFRTVRAAFPTDTALMTLEAQLHLRLGQNQQAAELAAQAVGAGCEDPLALLLLGMALQGLGRRTEALDVMIEAHRRFPDRADIACALVEQAAALHGLGAARPVFQEIFDRLGDHRLAICWAKLLFAAGDDADMPPGAVSGTATSVPAWIAQAGSTLDFVGEREAIPFQLPPVFGAPSEPHPKLSVPGYIPYACALPGATIFSRSSLILMPDGAILNDTLADQRFGRFMTLPHDKTVVARRGQGLLLDIGQHPVAEIDAGIMLSGWASEHFGHWVPEYLCRLSYLERHPRFADLPIIVDAGMPPQHLEFLRLLVSNPIVELPAGGALRCGELVVAGPSTFFPVHLAPEHEVPPENQGGLPVGGFRFLQSRIRQRLAPPAAADRKLYLSRKSRTWRRLVNEDEISAALAARGFEVLLPEEMSLEEQVRMYQAASMVVAPNGSSLLNAIFAPKDMKLIALSQRGLFNWGTYYGLMRELDYDLTFFCSDEQTDQKHADYSISVPRLLEAIEALGG